MEGAGEMDSKDNISISSLPYSMTGVACHSAVQKHWEKTRYGEGMALSPCYVALAF